MQMKYGRHKKILLQNIQKVFSQNDGRLAGTVMTQPVLGLTAHTTPF